MKKRTVQLGNRVMLTILVVGLCLFMFGGLKTYHSRGKHKEEIAENVNALKAMEEKQISDLNVRILEKTNLNLDEEKTKILSMKDQEFDNSELIKTFDDVVICGDSIVAAGLEYKWLNKSIIHGKTGVSLQNGDKVIKSAIKASPTVLFMCFGVNDIENYVDDVDSFIDDYDKVIDELKKKLPNTEIYIHSLFACQEGLEKTKTFYKYLDEYNEKLESLCAQKNVNFVDSNFLLKEMPELYDVDGVHPVRQFYPLWYTFLADIAGLSKNE